MSGDSDADSQSDLDDAGAEDADSEHDDPVQTDASVAVDGEPQSGPSDAGADAPPDAAAQSEATTAPDHAAASDGHSATDDGSPSDDLPASEGPVASEGSSASELGSGADSRSTSDDRAGSDSTSIADERVEDDGAAGIDVDASALDDDVADDLAIDIEETVLGEEPGDGDEQGLFEEFLDGEPIFENKEVLRPSYTPRELPHRSDQINEMATVLVSALRGDTPSNILIYGKTGTGKTASAQYVSQELERTSQKYEVPCDVEYINCEVTDTQYRVLAKLANEFNEENRTQIDAQLEDLEELRGRADDPAALADSGFESLDALERRIDELESDREDLEEVPMTGWPTDRVYNVFFDAVDYRERVVVIMLDEIDKLVEKSGDDTLYNLSRMNSDLDHSRVSIIGISNDLKFTDLLDPRVKSSLGEEEIVFPPYDATQLQDILEHRATESFKPDALSEDVIPLCAAFAAQEHGDARRALDLLRTAGELAERDDVERIQGDHVRKAQEKIELDRVVEVVRTLPMQSKLVLFAIVLLERKNVPSINTGEVYNVYDQLCAEIDADSLTQRRVTDLISELDMLGIVNAVVVSKGRYGRTKEINLSVPIDQTEAVLTTDSRLGELEDIQPHVQVRFDS